MSAKFKFAGLCLLMAVFSVASTGCVTQQGPYLGAFGIPIPVSPYFQKRLEDKHHEHERYERVPILGPLNEDSPDIGMDPPSDDEVFRVLENSSPVQGGLPFLHETQRNNVRIVTQKIADYVDPPRVYPLMGPAQLHHVHYKCTIFYDEIVRVGWPIPYTTRDNSTEVIYIDKSHLHMVGNVDPGVGTNY